MKRGKGQEATMKVNRVLSVLVVVAAVWIVSLQRRLESARRRGDMYRDISANLNSKLEELKKRS